MVFQTYVSSKTNSLPASFATYLAVPFQLMILMGTRQWKSCTSLGKLPSKDAFDYTKQWASFKVNFPYTCSAIQITSNGKDIFTRLGLSKLFLKQTFSTQFTKWPQTHLWIYLEMEKIYKPKLIFKAKEAYIIWVKTLKEHTCCSYYMDLTWTGNSLSPALPEGYKRRTMRDFSFPRVWFKKLKKKKYFLGSSPSLCFKVINFKFVSKSFFLFYISSCSSQTLQLYIVSPLKRPERETGSWPLVHAYLKLPLLRAFN